MLKTPTERVVARRVLRLILKGASAEETALVNKWAEKLGLVLEAPSVTQEERDLARVSNKRPGRTPGLRRGFGG